MPKRSKSSRPTTESSEVGGHAIEYRKVGDLETVTIDGGQAPFFRVGDDYQLESNAYAPEQPTLLKAAKAYVATLPARND